MKPREKCPHCGLAVSGGTLPRHVRRQHVGELPPPTQEAPAKREAPRAPAKGPSAPPASDAETFVSPESFRAALDAKRKAAEAGPAKGAPAPAIPAGARPYQPPIKALLRRLNKGLPENMKLDDEDMSVLGDSMEAMGLYVEQRPGGVMVLPWWTPIAVAAAWVILPRVPGIIKWAVEKAKAGKKKEAGAAVVGPTGTGSATGAG